MNKYSNFKDNFKTDITSAEEGVSGYADPLDEDLAYFFNRYGGKSFSGGLYRTFSLDEISEWQLNIFHMYPQLKGNIIPFGYDWLGRIFSKFVNDSSLKQSVTFAFPFEEQVLTIPVDIVSFHNEILISQKIPALESVMFDDFLQRKKLSSIARNECGALVKPFFLGGNFSIDNMELMDMDVYWTLSSQMLSKIKSS